MDQNSASPSWTSQISIYLWSAWLESFPLYYTVYNLTENTNWGIQCPTSFFYFQAVKIWHMFLSFPISKMFWLEFYVKTLEGSYCNAFRNSEIESFKASILLLESMSFYFRYLMASGQYILLSFFNICSRPLNWWKKYSINTILVCKKKPQK